MEEIIAIAGAEMACKNWAIEGNVYRKIRLWEQVLEKRGCYEEKEKNRWVGREVKKFKKDRTYKVDMFKLQK